MALLQQEEELQEIVQMVGIDALQEQERIVLTVSKMVREHFLRQSAYSETDASCRPEKAYLMLKAFLAFHTPLPGPCSPARFPSKPSWPSPSARSWNG